MSLGLVHLEEKLFTRTQSDAIIKAKNSKSVILLSQFDPQGGPGFFLDCLHMVSYYIPKHFKALNVTDQKIMGGF